MTVASGEIDAVIATTNELRSRDGDEIETRIGGTVIDVTTIPIAPIEAMTTGAMATTVVTTIPVNMRLIGDTSRA
jgi:pyridoxal biosynthesis lyase PdxS